MSRSGDTDGGIAVVEDQKTGSKTAASDTQPAGANKRKPLIVYKKRRKLKPIGSSKDLLLKRNAAEEENISRNLEEHIEKYTPRGRKLRKAFERPRPDLPAYADANRTRRSISITLPPELLETVNERCRELDVDRTAFIEAAIRLALKPS